MSTLKADAVTSAQDNTALTLSGTGTGGVKVNDFFVQTKGSDIASDTALTLGKDGNQFDVTGTTTITSIATQGIGSYVTLHFDGVLTFTHHSTNLILPGAANITTAAGDIAVMYEYASADWRCVSYTKASGAPVVAGGGIEFIEKITASTSSSITFAHTVEANYIYIIDCINSHMSADCLGVRSPKLQFGTGGTPTFVTSGYTNDGLSSQNAANASTLDAITTGITQWIINVGGVDASESWDSHIEIWNPGGSGETTARIWSVADGNNLDPSQNFIGGRYETAVAITGLRLLPITQTITDGDFYLSRRKLT